MSAWAIVGLVFCAGAVVFLLGMFVGNEIGPGPIGREHEREGTGDGD